MEILIIINTVAILIGAYWLTKENKAQSTIIATLKTQLDTLNPFVDIIRKVADPAEIDKLIAAKIQLLEHDTEIKRREVIANTIEQMQAQWQVLYENELKPVYTKSYNEFAKFVIAYFSQPTFSDKKERNAHIRICFPSTAENIISYLDKASGTTSDKPFDPLNSP